MNIHGQQGDIKDRFKNVFISQKNSGYLFDMIINKVIKSYPHFNNILLEFIETYKMNMVNLQEFILNDNFFLIYENNKKLEDVLIALNKITVSKFEYLLIQDLNKKYTNDEFDNYQVQNQDQNQHQNQDQNQHQNQVQNQHQNQVQNQHQNNFDESDKYSENEIELSERYIHFMSNDSYKNKGRYLYNIDVPKLKSIDLQSIYLKCDMYNINELNNKFYIIEQNVKTLITIPVGYYSIQNLVDCMTKFLNLLSVNKNKDYTFKIFLNILKNRVCFTINNNNEHNNNRNNYNYSLLFIENEYNYNLQKICGFDKIIYANNSIYVAENPPNTNIFEKIYMQIFLNDIPLNKYETTKNNFCYYDILRLDMEKDFGKGLTFNSENNQYDLYKEFDLNTISFQFNNNHEYTLDNLNFEIIVRFEYN
jgi:hypothetical protein